MFCKKDIPKNFTKLTGKYIRIFFFFNKVADCLQAVCNFIKKETSAEDVFPLLLWNFQEYLFHRTPLDECLCKFLNAPLELIKSGSDVNISEDLEILHEESRITGLQNPIQYSVSLCIQSECGKIRTRKNSVFGDVFCSYWAGNSLQLNTNESAIKY